MAKWTARHTDWITSDLETVWNNALRSESVFQVGDMVTLTAPECVCQELEIPHGTYGIITKVCMVSGGENIFSNADVAAAGGRTPGLLLGRGRVLVGAVVRRAPGGVSTTGDPAAYRLYSSTIWPIR